jgi:hypothetical protein
MFVSHKHHRNSLRSELSGFSFAWGAARLGPGTFLVQYFYQCSRLIILTGSVLCRPKFICVFGISLRLKPTFARQINCVFSSYHIVIFLFAAFAREYIVST